MEAVEVKVMEGKLVMVWGWCGVVKVVEVDMERVWGWCGVGWRARQSLAPAFATSAARAPGGAADEPPAPSQPEPSGRVQLSAE